MAHFLFPGNKERPFPITTALRENAPYNPEECLIDFLTQKEEELTPERDPVKRDEKHLKLLKDILKDCRIHGPKSCYIKEMIDSRLPWER